MIRDELEVHVSGLALEPLEPWRAESGFLMFQACVDVWLATCQQAVEQTGECVRHGGDGFGRAQPGTEASIGGAQGAFTVQEILRGEA